MEGLMNFSSRRLLMGMCALLTTMLPASALASWDFLDLFPDFYSSDSALQENEVQLVRVMSDAMPGYTDIRIVLDNDFTAQSIRLVPDQGDARNISLSELANGAVLLNQSGFDIFKLIGTRLDPKSGGELQLVYLSNGITHSYGKFDMEAVKQGDTWFLQTNNQGGRKPFKTLFVKSRKLFGRIIGIESVTPQ
jgi:hypothetical protein